MNYQLKSKIAVITGASSGIGACIARDLLSMGLIVVGLARRVERVTALRCQLSDENERQRLHAIQCDVTNGTEVARAFEVIAKNYGPVFVLINNAGCLRSGQLCTMAAELVQEVVQTNLMGVVHCTRHAFAAMQQASAKKYKTDGDGGGDGDGAATAAVKADGHVILINSILGHQVSAIPGHVPSLNVYPATKYALTAINEIYRQEFSGLGTNVKVTSISPGLVDTELISETQKRICRGKILQPEDVSRAVVFALTQPPHVQIYELTIKPMGEII